MTIYRLARLTIRRLSGLAIRRLSWLAIRGLSRLAISGLSRLTVWGLTWLTWLTWLARLARLARGRRLVARKDLRTVLMASSYDGGKGLLENVGGPAHKLLHCFVAEKTAAPGGRRWPRK